MGVEINFEWTGKGGDEQVDRSDAKKREAEGWELDEVGKILRSQWTCKIFL